MPMEFPKKSQDYNSLVELTESWDVIYGPFKSRRLGSSLGINVLGNNKKMCSYDCAYCELGSTTMRMKDIKEPKAFPTVEEIVEGVNSGFSAAIRNNTTFDVISLVGNGEPTIHPEFEKISEEIIKLKNALLPQKKIHIFTNGFNVESKKTVASLNLFDERHLKCDAGNDEMMKQVNLPLVRMSIAKLIAGSRKLTDFTLQSCFIQGVVDNTQTKHVEDWIETVGLLRPKAVHLYSLDRVPQKTGLIKATEETLDRIAAQLDRRTRIKATVFP